MQSMENLIQEASMKIIRNASLILTILTFLSSHLICEEALAKSQLKNPELHKIANFEEFGESIATDGTHIFTVKKTSYECGEGFCETTIVKIDKRGRIVKQVNIEPFLRSAGYQTTYTVAVYDNMVAGTVRVESITIGETGSIFIDFSLSGHYLSEFHTAWLELNTNLEFERIIENKTGLEGPLYFERNVHVLADEGPGDVALHKYDPADNSLDEILKLSKEMWPAGQQMMESAQVENSGRNITMQIPNDRPGLQTYLAARNIYHHHDFLANLRVFGVSLQELEQYPPFALFILFVQRNKI